MIDVQATATTPLLQSSGVEGERNTVERDQFLKLLVAQMKYQDPMNPMEGTEFTAQLAQFSSLEQLFLVNENLEGVQAAQNELTHLQMTGYIGKTVVSEGSRVNVVNGSAHPMKYELNGSAAAGNVTIYDAAGSVVRIIDLGPRDAGAHEVNWDARDMDLNPVPDGDYRFQVNFYSDSDAFIPSRTYQSGKVQGLVFEGGKTLLDLGYARVPIQEILEVIETPALAAGEASSGQ